MDTWKWTWTWKWMWIWTWTWTRTCTWTREDLCRYYTKKIFCEKSTKVDKNPIELTCGIPENQGSSEFRGIPRKFAQLRQTSLFGIPKNSAEFNANSDGSSEVRK